jgi:tRNA G18 (ribose-2'-O)-methylase SpoU
MNIEAYREADKLPIVVVLDNIRSQHNVGAVFRTADAMRIERVVLCGICCSPPNTEIHKTALGAEESVEWQYYKETLDAVHDLQKEGYTVYAVEQVHDSMTLEEAAKEVQQNKEQGTKIAIVLGHEVFGVQQSVVDQCTQCIEIPQYGTKHSMNVSVTAGIVMYRLSEAMREIGR